MLGAPAAGGGGIVEAGAAGAVVAAGGVARPLWSRLSGDLLTWMRRFERAAVLLPLGRNAMPRSATAVLGAGCWLPPPLLPGG